MIDVLLRTALTGSAVTLSWLAVNALLGKRLPALWHYRVLKLALFLFLVPVWTLAALAAKLTANLAPAAPVTAPELTPAPQIPVTVLPAAPVSPAAPLPEAAPVALSVDLFQVLTAVWAIGAAAVLGYKLWVYIRFRRSVLRQNRAVSDPETREVFTACKAQLGLRRTVALRQNPLVPTPLSTGLLRPVVILPTLSLSREELRYLFLHELTHIKRHDLWVRFFSMLAAALHWYDPLVYVLNKQIKNLSEQSCDERVSAPLDRGERFAYGSVLLKLAADTVAGPCEWAVSLSAKDTLERRLIRVLHSEKLKGRKRLLAFSLAAAILACGTAAALAARSPLVQREDEPPTQNIQDENAALRETLAKYEGQKETDTAVWFTPADIHDIETAELVWWDGTVYTLKDPSAPDVLESLLNGASAVTPSGCPFHSMLYLRRSDGVTGKVLPAEDSCDILQSDGAYYSLGMGNNESFYALFGVNTDELPQYTNAAAQKPEETGAENADAAQSSKTAAVLYPDALRGDTDLILSRGGTLLPDNEESSYDVINGIAYKLFLGKDGYLYDEYLVGNQDVLSERKLKLLDTLADGDYPKNSKGESYGDGWLASYVGYQPDLDVATGIHGESGYTRPADEVSHNLPAAECPHVFFIPLYDSEGNEIGKCELGCGGHMAESGMSIEEAKKTVAEAGTDDIVITSSIGSEPNPFGEGVFTSGKWSELTDTAIRGDTDLILARGGTLLPDNEDTSYVCLNSSFLFKVFATKNSTSNCTYFILEYEVGNKNAIADRYLSWLDTLVDGEYPKNSKGQSYGLWELAGYVGYYPDLTCSADEFFEKGESACIPSDEYWGFEDDYAGFIHGQHFALKGYSLADYDKMTPADFVS